jgi:pyruvate ferredoxin oxidoreductase gamma subunit
VVLINTGADPDEVDVETDAEVVTVDATEIALDHLGKPIMNTALLGAFAGATGLIEQESVEEVIEREWGGKIGRQNVAASTDAFTEVQA